ncbi:MAG: CDP-alcohol phosphatidyltransferase family protein [Phycisphaerales bacterium]|nr:CDP-alcohol phosphatidyltransferase family protein [Phycisphaerales bacterium]
MLSIPFLVQAILNRQVRIALAILFFAALTDAIDGALARRFGMATGAGAYFDPIADKLLLSAVYVSLAVAGSVPVWLVVLVFSRDAIILAAAAVALRWTALRRFPPSIWGKASTFLQIVYALAVMMGVLEWLIWPVAALTALSGLHYVWRGAGDLRRLTPGETGSSLKESGLT